MNTWPQTYAALILATGVVTVVPFALLTALAFGLSLIAAGVLTAWVRTHEAGETTDGVAEPVGEADAAERRAA